MHGQANDLATETHQWRSHKIAQLFPDTPAIQIGFKSLPLLLSNPQLLIEALPSVSHDVFQISKNSLMQRNCIEHKERMSVCSQSNILYWSGFIVAAILTCLQQSPFPSSSAVLFAASRSFLC